MSYHKYGGQHGGDQYGGGHKGGHKKYHMSENWSESESNNWSQSGGGCRGSDSSRSNCGCGRCEDRYRLPKCGGCKRKNPCKCDICWRPERRVYCKAGEFNTNCCAGVGGYFRMNDAYGFSRVI